MEDKTISSNVEVKDVIKAGDVALDYLSKQGIVVFRNEINSIFKKSVAWFVMVESVRFTGVIIIKSTTGKVLTMVKF